MSADNFKVTMQAPMSYLGQALKLACTYSKIEGYLVVTGALHDHLKPKDVENQTQRLILCWLKKDGVIPFPAPMKPEDLVPFIEAWLESADWGKGPDLDGDRGKGFYLTTGDAWRHICDIGHHACLEIRPWWMMYGK